MEDRLVGGVSPYFACVPSKALPLSARRGGRHGSAIPRVVYTTPTVYAVGITPGQAAKLGIDLCTAGYDLAATPRAAV